MCHADQNLVSLVLVERQSFMEYLHVLLSDKLGLEIGVTIWRELMYRSLGPGGLAVTGGRRGQCYQECQGSQRSWRFRKGPCSEANSDELQE